MPIEAENEEDKVVVWTLVSREMYFSDIETSMSTV
jgi:hypothetical protein